jgi:outer membrane protein W
MSTFASPLLRSRWALVATIAVLLLGLSLPALAEDAPKKVRRFGNPVTAFSTQPAETMDALKSQFQTHRADLEDVIRQSGWAGNAADLFQAVQDGKVKRVQVPVGEQLRWMAFRKNKVPTVTHNLVWAGKQAFDAWHLEFVSNGTIYEFLIPAVCLNLSFYKERPAPKPSCSLSASVGAAECDRLSQISLSGTAEGGDLEVTVSGGSSSGLSSAGANRWTYTPSAAGTFQFTGTVTNEYGLTATCSASASVAAAVPCVKCNIDATYDPDGRTFTVDGAGSVGTLEITGITHPDGSAGDMSKLIASDGDRWTYSPKRRRPGTYTFAARAETGGVTAECSDSDLIPEPDVRWVFRAVGARVEADDAARSSIFLPDGSNQRDYFAVEPGYGVGASLERIFSPRIGLEFGALIANVDSYFLRDIDVDWADDHEDIGLKLISIGPNFHLTPNRKVDLYFGPFLGYVELDGATYQVLGTTVRTDGEDEFTWGAQLGLDVPAASKWAFTAGIRYLDLSYDLEEGANEADDLELSLDPLIFTVGVAYRF